MAYFWGDEKLISCSFVTLQVLQSVAQSFGVDGIIRMDINYFQTADTSPLHDLYLSLECSSSLANYRWS